MYKTYVLINLQVHLIKFNLLNIIIKLMIDTLDVCINKCCKNVNKYCVEKLCYL